MQATENKSKASQALHPLSHGGGGGGGEGVYVKNLVYVT